MEVKARWSSPVAISDDRRILGLGISSKYGSSWVHELAVETNGISKNNK